MNATYTNDPARVTHVHWNIPSERVMGEDEQDTNGIFEKRMTHVRAKIEDAAEAYFPNATAYCANSGVDGQYATQGERAITDDDSIFEPFFDVMAEIEESAIASAFWRYPIQPGEDED